MTPSKLARFELLLLASSLLADAERSRAELKHLGHHPFTLRIIGKNVGFYPLLYCMYVVVCNSKKMMIAIVLCGSNSSNSGEQASVNEHTHRI